MTTHTTAFVVGGAALLPGRQFTPARDLAGLAFPLLDAENGGTGQIVATVLVDDSPTDLPIEREVFLLVEPSMRRIRSTWSDPVTGAYQFDNINATRKYTVIAVDYLHSYRAVIADNLTPTAMP